MAEHWIPASKALEIARDRYALCSRLHAGIIPARARLFKVGDRQKERFDIPPKFWWAGGHEALEQDWRSGDFSTWIDQKFHWQAFGVELSLAGVLEMLDFEQRAIIARSLSVAGNAQWVSAMDARSVAYQQMGFTATTAEWTILEQGKLGFLSARAVLAQAAGFRGHSLLWEEREWNVPGWFWTRFVEGRGCDQDWTKGRFVGEGSGPDGIGWIELSGVHFTRESLAAAGLVPADTNTDDEQERGKRGRKPIYNWDAAVASIWGLIFRGDFKPQTQAEIEAALQKLLATKEREPSESTVRPYASRIWTEIAKA